MFKFGLNIFGFLKSFVDFIKVLTVFSSMIFCLYWAQQLMGSEWRWFSYVMPLVSPFIVGGKFLFSLFGKFIPFPSDYLFVIVAYIVFYMLLNYVNFVIDAFKGMYEDTNKSIRKYELKQYNKSIQKEQTDTQTKLNNYKVLIKTELKQKYVRIKTEKDYNEQTQIMLDFLNSKFNMLHKNFEGGYLYDFTRFYDIDKVLDVLFKLIQSESILNYKISIQIVDSGNSIALNNIKFLSNLNFSNKICMLANTEYRYQFNIIRKYDYIPLGVFQRDNDNVEVYEFKEKV